MTAVEARSEGTTALLRVDPARLDPVFERLRARVETDRALPAAALAVADADGPIRVETFSQGAPISRDSIYFLASVTKPIFATAFMQLIEDGSIGLHQPIADFEPGLRNGGKEVVTPWHILTHTSGVMDLQPEMIRRLRPSPQQITQLLLDSPLRFEPGSRYEYNSASFYLLGLLMEKLTGLDYIHFLDERLQRPLGMSATFDPRRTGRPIVTVENAGVDSRVKRYVMVRWLARTALPGGGLFGTLDDLLRFGGALLRPRDVGDRVLPLRPETIALMAEDQTRGEISGEIDGEVKRVHFALGWGKPTLMSEIPGSPRVISHGGATGTRIWIDPDSDLVFVFFTNRWATERAVEVEALRGTYEALRA